MAESKVKWESLEFTVTEGLGDLARMQNEVTRETRECTTLMNAPATDKDDPWTIVILLENLQTSKVSLQKRIKEVETSLEDLYKEVAHGPAPTDKEEADTYKSRGFKHREFLERLKVIKKNFNEWKLRLQQIIEKHEVKYNTANPDDGDDGDPDDGDDEPATPRRGARSERHRDRGRESNNNMKDATALRPGILDTTMNVLAINMWMDNFNSYRFASGWSAGPHHVQKAYLKNVLSEDIMIAIDFRHTATVDEILDNVKAYLQTNVAPIELTRLEALRY